MNILNSFDHFIGEAQKNQTIHHLDFKQLLKRELERVGLPNRKEESWRNTSVKFLNEQNFSPVIQATNELSEAGRALLLEKTIPNSCSLIFVNGFFMKSLSSIEPDGLRIELSDSSQKPSPAMAAKTFMASLNNLYSLNSVTVTIEGDQPRPVHIINLVDGQNLLVSPNLQIVVKSNKEAKIILSNLSTDSSVYLFNTQIAVDLERDSRLELINHIDQSPSAYHFDQLNFTAASHSHFRYFEMNFNSKLIRHDLTLNLNGENIHSEVLSASYLKEKQHCDSQTLINHNQSHSRSEQIYKSVLDDESHSVFAGTVFIAKDIIKADSSQLNQNLLLSDKAEVNSQPILRIYSDDVKASHGSTMGQIQEDEIFYLQSRGITRTKAIELLGQGFLNEIILRFGSDDLKHYFSNELFKAMAARRRPILKVIN